jgi:hypothetical protein
MLNKGLSLPHHSETDDQKLQQLAADIEPLFKSDVPA